jgi:hypothetical protein
MASAPNRRRRSALARRVAYWSRVPEPWAQPWKHAVHVAGNCVMAYVLDLEVTVIRFDRGRGAMFWERPSSAFRFGSSLPAARAAAEADALVALAGGVARHIYPAAITAADLRADDMLADSILETAERNWSVIPAWREYLRHRALAMLVPTERKALIARLASHLMRVAYMDPKKLRPFLDEARGVVASYANETFHVADYVAVYGPAPFPTPVEDLGLRSRLAASLAAARITTLGQLLRRSFVELASVRGVSRADVKAIQAVLSARDYKLAPRPELRATVRSTRLAVEALYRLEEGDAIYEDRHRPRF